MLVEQVLSFLDFEAIPGITVMKSGRQRLQMPIALLHCQLLFLALRVQLLYQAVHLVARFSLALCLCICPLLHQPDQNGTSFSLQPLQGLLLLGSFNHSLPTCGHPGQLVQSILSFVGLDIRGSSIHVPQLRVRLCSVDRSERRTVGIIISLDILLDLIHGVRGNAAPINFKLAQIPIPPHRVQQLQPTLHSKRIKRQLQMRHRLHFSDQQAHCVHLIQPNCIVAQIQMSQCSVASLKPCHESSNTAGAAPQTIPTKGQTLEGLVHSQNLADCPDAIQSKLVPTQVQLAQGCGGRQHVCHLHSPRVTNATIGKIHSGNISVGLQECGHAFRAQP
mmetsp:Transcript_82661/g.188914  ORF Transcript_82661/g.188914 Transcript_82661/m.188914 type:complete len:334 (-) Transcript_82661:17-1018(-)